MLGVVPSSRVICFSGFYRFLAKRQSSLGQYLVLNEPLFLKTVK